MTAPKIFISYSWSTSAFQNQVRLWAERLASDGIEIILDQFDLREGQDKYHYMERMVSDKTVTHVLMFIDKRYAEKANERKAGVGTESQIISREVYEKVDQSKFVPIVCEMDEHGAPYLPVFLGTRIWLDFSNEEAVNKNWERLIRLLHGKPLFEKPTVGKPPAYITEDTTQPSNPAAGKFSVLRNAITTHQRGIKTYRIDFLDSCISFVDELRPRQQPAATSDVAQMVVDRFRQLVPIRNLVADWVLLEGSATPREDFEDALLEFLERLLEVKGRPQDVSSWNESWYEAHSLFVFETFIYVIAALLKLGLFNTLNAVLMGSYLSPDNMRSRRGEFVGVGAFYGYTEIINSALTTENQRYHSQAIELVKRSADRKDIPFSALKEADSLIHLAATLKDEHWYPQSHYYASFGDTHHFFLRAAQRRHFAKLATIIGIPTGDKLREIIAAKNQEKDTWRRKQIFSNLVNLEKLDTIV